MRSLSIAALVVFAGNAEGQIVPRIDYHQHLFSPPTALLISPAPPAPVIAPITAKDLIALMNAAGIRRALVLSTAYTWSSANRNVEDDYTQVRAANDWTSKQVAQYPDRLRGFCSLNPLKPYALEELARCAKDPQLKHGLKLHIGNSGVDYHNAEHVAKVREIFRAANANQMAIVVHMRASISRKLAYGADEARIFIDSILTAAPDVPVQIAHMAGAGDYDLTTHEALGVFTDAIAKHDPRMKNVWFDVTTVVTKQSTEGQIRAITDRIRQIGVERVLYGSDADTGLTYPPKENWATFMKLGLSAAELTTIANNVTPYMKW